MRFFDFLHDIDETSARISQRGAILDTDTVVRLTLNTLVRPDVLQYFESLLEDTRVTLCNFKRLLFHVVLFGYTVNIRPRPGHADLSEFAHRIAPLLERASISKDKSVILNETRAIKLPHRALRALNSLLKLQKSKSGFYCLYCVGRPSETRLASLCRQGFRDASLILYEGEAMPDMAIKSDRITYSGPVFTSASYRLSGVYIRSLR